eukprot:3581922-Alexandrium_andersonii.AAC.1
MSASLVGSEMCIRDRTSSPRSPPARNSSPAPAALSLAAGRASSRKSSAAWAAFASTSSLASPGRPLSPARALAR